MFGRMYKIIMEENVNQTTTKGLMNMESEKGIILAGMFIATITFGMFPIKLVISNPSVATANGENEYLTEVESRRKKRNAQWWKTVISLANCFSGGVFVGACLLDLIPGKLI